MKNKQVHYISDPEQFLQKEKLYLDLRRREGRVLPDDVVKNLPKVPRSSPHWQEWRWRERSLRRFLNQLPESLELSGSSTLRILDLGCGNGWMANRLAENPACDVWAVDLNQEELEQGARLFGQENLQFAYADVLEGGVSEKTFDFIVLAASVQYFPDLGTLLQMRRNLLNPRGEIHILDSNFYKNEMEQTAARERTLAYYTKVGVPEMINFYHHHLWSEAEKLGAENLNDTLKTKILQKAKWLAPFPWIRLKK